MWESHTLTAISRTWSLKPESPLGGEGGKGRQVLMVGFSEMVPRAMVWGMLVEQLIHSGDPGQQPASQSELEKTVFSSNHPLFFFFHTSQAGRGLHKEGNP